MTRGRGGGGRHAVCHAAGARCAKKAQTFALNGTTGKRALSRQDRFELARYPLNLNPSVDSRTQQVTGDITLSDPGAGWLEVMFELAWSKDSEVDAGFAKGSFVVERP